MAKPPARPIGQQPPTPSTPVRQRHQMGLPPGKKD